MKRKAWPVWKDNYRSGTTSQRSSYRRVLGAPQVDVVEKEKMRKLRQEYAKLNPVELEINITTLQFKIGKLAAKENIRKEAANRIMKMKKIKNI